MEKKEKRHLLVSNNKVNCYVNLNSLPKGYKHIEDLSHKAVVYRIKTKAGKIYIGSTGDFGERMDTHSKNARNKETEMYYDMRSYGEYDVDIIAVYDTIEEARNKEKNIIDEYKVKEPKELLGKKYFLLNRQEIDKVVSEKLYNIKNF